MTLLAIMKGITKIGTVSSGKMNAAGKAMDKFSVLGNVGDKVSGGLDKMMQAINPFAPVIEALSDIFSVWGDILGAAFMPLIEKLYEIMMSPAVMAALDALGKAFGEVITALMPIIDALAPIIPLIIQALILPLKILAPILEAITPLFQALTPAIDAVGVVIQIVSNAIDTAVAWIKEIISKLNPEEMTAENIMQGVISQGGTAEIGAGFTEFARRFLESFGMPGFASGGYVDSPQLAMVGEDGPEFIIPESDLISSSDVNQSVIINVYGNVRETELAEIQKSTWLASIR